MSALTASETKALRTFELLEPILKNTLTRFEQQELSNIDRSYFVLTLALLGFGYEFRGNSQAALEYYSRGLQFEPYNDALLVARGTLLYGTSPRAITDLEMAIRDWLPSGLALRLSCPSQSGERPLRGRAENSASKRSA